MKQRLPERGGPGADGRRERPSDCGAASFQASELGDETRVAGETRRPERRRSPDGLVYLDDGDERVFLVLRVVALVVRAAGPAPLDRARPEEVECLLLAFREENLELGGDVV